MKRILSAAAALLFSTAALAFHCPADMAKIDAAMAKNPKLTEAQMAEVKKYRAEGESTAQGRQASGVGRHAGQGDEDPQHLVIVSRRDAPPAGGVSFSGSQAVLTAGRLTVAVDAPFADSLRWTVP